MKLLGWMHRKLIQNNIEPWKNPTIGTASSLAMQKKSEEQHYYIEEPSTRLSEFSKSSNYNESTKLEQTLEPFDLLSIGTFGFELLNPETPTPTLAPTTNNEQIDITENDLDLISHELEKFLDAQDTEFSNDTSQRSSHASIMTLSCYKANEKGGADSEGHINMASPCPLQNYLFAASVELVDTEEAKRERASLGDLFRKNDTLMEKCEGTEEKQSRKGDVAHFVKKVVNKFHPSSNPTKKKLSKSVAKMFQKKVYPEEMTENQLLNLRKKSSNSHEKNMKKDKVDDTEMKRAAKKKTMKLSWTGICRGASPLNSDSEHWIKTDSDYLVLEL